MTTKEERLAAVREQLANPQHCYIRMASGRLFSHKADPRDPWPWDGQPVRFTKLAAQQLLKTLPGAIMVPALQTVASE